MNTPLISVIIPTYNAAATLEQAMLSVIEQDYPQTELIVIDGDSNDGTVDIIQSYDGQVDYWVSEADQGIYDAINKGIEKVTGDWVIILGADDILVNILHKVAPLLQDENTVYYGSVYRKGSNEFYDGPFTYRKLLDKNICQQAIFYPMDFLTRNKFSLDYPIFADYVYNLTHWKNSSLKWQYIPWLISIYDERGISSRGSSEGFRKFLRKKRANHFQIDQSWAARILEKIGF